MHQREIETIHPSIMERIKKLNISFAVTNYITDLRKNLSPNKDYGYNLEKQNIRGLISDELHLIAIAYKTTKIEDIGGILYHELGHFIDLYSIYGKVESLFDMPLSASEKFIQAYEKDFDQHYHLIKNDTNYRLKHFIQDSTPNKINQSAICETFAELFRYANGKTNDTRTVELYFPNALEALTQLVTKEEIVLLK